MRRIPKTINYLVTCSQCKVPQFFRARICLNIRARPKDKKDLLDGTVHRFVCCDCDHETSFDFQLLYDDRKKRLLVAVNPDPPTQFAGFSFSILAKHYEMRQVFTRNELIEKVLIRDARLDDRLVEYAKVMIRTRALQTSQPIDGDLMFSGVVKNDEGEKDLHFQDVTGDVRDRVFPFRLEFYKNLEKLLPSLLKKMPKQKSLWLRIDRAYAEQLDKLVDATDKPRKKPRR